MQAAALDKAGIHGVTDTTWISTGHVVELNIGYDSQGNVEAKMVKSVKALESALIVLLMASAVASKEFEFVLGGDGFRMNSQRSWSLSPDNKTKGLLLSLHRPRVKVFVDPFPDSSVVIAKQYIQRERSHAMLDHKEPIKQIDWGNGSPAFLWSAPNCVLLYFTVRGKWYRGFIQHAGLDSLEIDSIIRDLKTLK